MKNPKWHRDELIITLNLYFDKSSGPFIESNPKIIELSKILNKLPIYSQELRESNFRNTSGVAMKLGNFTAIDPNGASKGLDRYSKLDEKVFFEFENNIEKLKKIS